MSSAVSVVSWSSVGSSTATSRVAWLATAASNRLRASRPLPKPAVAGLCPEVAAQRRLGTGVERVAPARADGGEDAHELVVAVVGEVDGLREP